MVWGAAQITGVLTFFYVFYTLGWSLELLFLKKYPKTLLYRTLLKLGLGVATFPLLTVLFNTVHIPLHHLSYIFAGTIVPAYMLLMKKKEIGAFKKPKFNETLMVGILLIVILVLYGLLMWKGANAYPYLEDDDPWGYAQGSAYVSTMKTYNVNPIEHDLASGFALYLQGYPPSYVTLMGTLHKVTGNMLWTLRLFNVLLIVLALAFTFLLARKLLDSDVLAVLATIALASLPSYMSHFIWSQSLALAVFPIALYCFIQSLEDKQWRIPTVIAIASMMVTQVFASILFGFTIMLIILSLFIAETFKKKKVKKLLKRYKQTITGFCMAGVGLVLSLIYWIPASFSSSNAETTGGLVENFLNAYGSSTYVLAKYAWKDIFFAPKSSMIDQAIGWGPIIVIFLFLGILVYLWLLARGKLRDDWRRIFILLWTILLVYLVIAPTLGLPSFGTSRAWAYAALPLAFLVADTAGILSRSISKQALVRYGILGTVAVLLLLTNLPAKVAVQTATWPPGAHWNSQQEIQGYVALQDVLPLKTRVLPLCGSSSRVIGLNMWAEPWSKEENGFKTTVMNASADEVIAFMTSHGYNHMTMDATCVRMFGQDAVQNFMTNISGSRRFAVPMQVEGGFMLLELQPQ